MRKLDEWIEKITSKLTTKVSEKTKAEISKAADDILPNLICLAGVGIGLYNMFKHPTVTSTQSRIPTITNFTINNYYLDKIEDIGKMIGG